MSVEIPEWKKDALLGRSETMEYKERIREPGVQHENIEKAESLEWGPELGRMSYKDALVKITELNLKLRKGESLWRLPTADELMAAFSKASGFSHPLNAGFKGDNYWSRTSDPTDDDFAYVITDGGVSEPRSYEKAYDGEYNSFVRLVRDAA